MKQQFSCHVRHITFSEPARNFYSDSSWQESPISSSGCLQKSDLNTVRDPPQHTWNTACSSLVHYHHQAVALLLFFLEMRSSLTSNILAGSLLPVIFNGTLVSWIILPQFDTCNKNFPLNNTRPRKEK